MGKLTVFEVATVRIAIQDKMERCKRDYEQSREAFFLKRLKELKSAYKKLEL